MAAEDQRSSPERWPGCTFSLAIGSGRRCLQISPMLLYDGATATGITPIFAIATIFKSGTFGFRAGHASNLTAFWP